MINYYFIMRIFLLILLYLSSASSISPHPYEMTRSGIGLNILIDDQFQDNEKKYLEGIYKNLSNISKDVRKALDKSGLVIIIIKNTDSKLLNSLYPVVRGDLLENKSKGLYLIELNKIIYNLEFVKDNNEVILHEIGHALDLKISKEVFGEPISNLKKSKRGI